MQNKIKKFLKNYDSLSSIDGILCGILIFALLRSPWSYIGAIALMIMAVIAFGVNTLSRTETDEKRRRRQQIADFTHGLSLIVYIATVINIAIGIFLLLTGKL